MKRELIFLIGLSSAIYATQEISCVEFVNMQKAEAKSYLDNYRKGFELNHFKTKNHTKVDKQYIGMQGGVSRHLLNCIDLRRVTYYGVEDVRRALILASLSKKNLSQEEQILYQNSLNKNRAYYSAYSNSSLINGQYMPLVYLTIQRSKDKKYYIIYEFRKNGAEIKRYSKKILVSKPYIKFSDITAVSNQNYLSYIQQQYPNIQQYKEKRKSNLIKKQVNAFPNSQNISSEEKYTVIKSFDALYDIVKPNNFITIYPKDILIKLRKEGGNVYFLDKNKNEYFASKIWWKQGTKRVGVVE